VEERKIDICCGLISEYPAELAAFAGEKKLDKLSETMDSVGDFRVFTYAPWARYPAEGEAGYSVVRQVYATEASEVPITMHDNQN
jgi:hypothetical protein